MAERKNHHLIEIARTLLIHYNVPFPFWANSILTTCFLILVHKIHITCFQPNVSLYLYLSVNLVVRALFITIPLDWTNYVLNSLNVFSLGTLEFKKDIDIILLTLQYYLSADVTFFESSPYFTVSSSPSSIPVTPLPVVPIPKPPLQVYRRHTWQRQYIPTPPSPAPIDDSSLVPSPSSVATPQSPVVPHPDWKARADVVKLLKDLKKELTLLVVSHDLNELAPLVDRSWRMEMDGVLKDEHLPV
ncbi:uncharacterized protein LOC127257963 isoform X3 [Andrographis paniculata]|uniref:uncharacterized protein LOC127257963 isoform X3 n=1 Tax=Andrographis paniculata TaxID=175694 RepID=UPI0021E9236E|nr:uncharacterized protein LOC127257963 isoform X3 [Andrographis paniculata]